MPIYCFEKRDSGEIVELALDVSEMEAMRVPGDDINFKLEDGSIAFINYAAQHGGFKGSGDTPWRDHWSDALGVGTHEIEKRKKQDIKDGVHVDYCPKTGRAKVNSMKHQREIMRARGLINRASFM